MNVTILGVDATGRHVAQSCAIAAHPVSIHANHPSDAMDAIDAVEHALEKQGHHQRTLDATTGLRAAVRGADIVIETTTTDEAALHDLFAEIETFVGSETLLATSAPTVSLADVTTGLGYPERVLGLRFHDDASMVEIVSTDQTSRETVERAISFVESLDAVALAVQETPGMVSERLIAALEVEAMRLLADGVASAETIDELLVTGYDHPIGPLERADRNGLGKRLELLEYLASELGEQYRPPELLRQRVAVGKTGMDAGEGFYIWEQGEPVKSAIEH